MADKIALMLIACPAFLIPIFAALTFTWWLFALLLAIAQRIRGPKVIYTPKKDSDELTESIRSGYSPRLGLELGEIFPDPVMAPDIDRILAVREKLFPTRLIGFLHSDEAHDLSPTERKAMALRLFVEMAFMRSYLLENSSRLWPQKTESLWTFHAPKALRKLNPDYYAQLLAEVKEKGRTQTAA